MKPLLSVRAIARRLQVVQRTFQAGLAAVAQRHEGLAELLAAGLHPQAGIVADTVDRAEDAVDGRQHGVDARHRLPQAAIVMDQLSSEVAGDLAQMRHLAIAPADIEETAPVETGFPRNLRRRLCLAALAAKILLPLTRHASPVCWLLSSTRFHRARGDHIKHEF